MVIRHILKKSTVEKGCMRSSLIESVIVTEFQAEAYSSLDLTKAKHSISTLSVVEKPDVIVRLL
jgi:hypothetical protein